eukprot:scaffold12438_cov147-Skeletonema_marinoi.AAC.4
MDGVRMTAALILHYEFLQGGSTPLVPICLEFVASVFEVNETFWNVEISLQVKWLCQEEPFAGSYPRQDNVNPISTSIVPLTDNKCILGHTLQLMPGRCYVGVDGSDGDLGHCSVSNFEVGCSRWLAL